MKKFVSILLVTIMMFLSTIFVYASETSEYILEEVPYGNFENESKEELPCPYTLYIMGVTTHITDKGDGKIYMGVEVYCTHIMKKITTNFYLQQLINNKWVDVARHTCVGDDTDYMIAFVSVAQPPSGTYRVQTMTMVEDYNGFAEATEGVSGAIDFISPYT